MELNLPLMLEIALFGTSADPPTLGHQTILEWLSQRFNRVLVWAADNPFKGDQTPLEHRQEMLRLLMQPLQAQHPNLEFTPELSDRYTLRTLQQAQQRWPEATFTLVVGSDVIAKLPQWYRAEELLAQVQLLIIPRPGVPLTQPELEQLQQRGAQLAIADFEGPAISSSAYREEGRTEGLTAAVQAYIDREGLYPCTDTAANGANPRPMDAAAGPRG